MQSSRDILSVVKKPNTPKSVESTSTHIYFKPDECLLIDDCDNQGSIHTYSYNLGVISSDQLKPKAVLGLMDMLEGDIVKKSYDSEKRSVFEVLSEGVRSIVYHYTMLLNAELDFSASIALALEKQSVLDSLYWEAINKKFIDKQPIVMQVTQGDATTYKVTKLTFKMHAASKVNGMKPDRVYILGTMLGAGTFGEVYEHRATLKYSYAESRVVFKEKTVKSKVSKLLYPHTSRDWRGRSYDRAGVKKECAFMHRLGYFGNVRHCDVTINGEGAGILVSRKFPGRPLRVVLDEDRYKRLGKRYINNDNQRLGEVDTFKLLSLEDRYLISMALIKSLHLVHAHSIKHLDIKPDNIIAAKSALSWRTRIIDTGLSEESDTPVELKGTVLYVAPEFESKLTDKSDIFSLGRLMGILWGDEEFFERASSAITNTEFVLDLVRNDSRKLKLFIGMDAGRLKPTDLYAISKILHSMVSRYPWDRPKLLGDSSVLDCFQQGYENYLLITDQMLNEQARLDIREVGACARSLNNCLIGLYGQELTDEILDKIKVAIIHSMLSNGCGFDDNAIAQKLLKQTLGFRCLESSQLCTFNGIKARMVDIVDLFAVAKNDLFEKIKELKEVFDISKASIDDSNKELKHLIDGISVIEYKLIKCPPNLDDMQETARIVKRKAEKIQAALNRYREAVKVNDAKIGVGLNRKF